jgi:plasmanylethanolamine desaturase
MHTVLEAAGVAAQLAACMLLADLLSGFFHWLEDAYGHPDWPVIGPLITRPNIVHHHDPGYFTRHSWLRSADVLLVLGGLILLAAAVLQVLDWRVGMVVAVGINANEIHKWAHRPRGRNPALVRFLQDVGVIQSPAHHAGHHRGGKDSHYCVITDYLNPILDRLRVWTALEGLIRRLTGIRRRRDTSLEPL